MEFAAEELRQMLNVIKYQMHQLMLEDNDRERELAICGLMGRMSNVQALLETDNDRFKPDMMGALGQHEAWDEAFANRGAPAADDMFGPRCYALEA
jgi:hypothetical protein